MNTLVDQIEAHILSGCTNNQKRAIGTEIETILYNSNGERISVDRGAEYSAADLIEDIDSGCKDINTFVTCSLEPGGQVEWASRPAFNIHDIHKEWNDIQTILKRACIDNKLTIVDLALDPIYSPNDIKLINHRKYQLMNDRFLTTGKHGQWMMRNSASVQVNLDLMDKKDAEECGFIADCISPLAAVLFSNAPFKNGRPIGYENIRYRIWEDTDPARCGHFLDHGIQGADGLLNQFCHYILDVPVIYTTPDKNDNVGFYDGTIKQWLESTTENNELNSEDIKTALHQIFTHGRYKTVLEIRSTDRPPKGYEFAPIAFWQALMEQGKPRDTLLGKISNWSLSERMEINLKASTLDMNQLGPNNKTIFQWFEWLAELVYDSLDNRASELNIDSEKIYIEPFFESVLSNGVFTLQSQERFAEKEIPIKEFIMKKNAII